MTEKKKPEFEEELEENQAEAVATTETGSSEVEQLSAHRNLDRCMHFQASCDPSLLNAPDMALVAEAYRQRRARTSGHD